jgi:hypothetical protein
MQMGGVRLGAAAAFVPREHYFMQYTEEQQRIRDQILHLIHIIHSRITYHHFGLQEADLEAELKKLLALYEEFKKTYPSSQQPVPAQRKQGLSPEGHMYRPVPSGGKKLTDGPR